MKRFALPLLVTLFVMLIGVTSAQEEGTVITMWHVATDGDSFGPVLQPAIEAFNERRSDFTIVATEIDNDPFKTQFQIASSAGEQPDVFQTWGGGGLKAFADAGIAAPIPELAGETLFIPGALAASTFDGQNYAFPMKLAAVVLWTNDALFEEYAVEIPETWDQFLAACEAFSEAGIVPMAMGNADRWPGSHWYSYVLTRLGGPEPFLAALNREIPFNAPVFIEAGERIQEAVNAGCFNEGFNGTSNEDAQAIMGLGMAGMRLMGNWDLGGLRDIDADLVYNSFSIRSFPVFEGADGLATEVIGGVGQSLGISTRAPEGTGAAILDLVGTEEFGRAVAANGDLPALRGFDDLIEDPIGQQVAALLGEATYLQLYYDQFLPPALAEAHLDTVQGLFGLTLTPQEAADIMERTAVEQLGAVTE